MKYVFRRALVATLPVLSGYVVLGFGFGLLLQNGGYGIGLTLAMSGLIYAGSMQYAAVGLLGAGAPLLTVALTTLTVNARHLFYGISMLQRYRGAGKRRAYLIFALTDETYSLLCRDDPAVPAQHRHDYQLCVTLLNHFYWVFGSLLGAAAGAWLPIPTAGIDFALTALFLTVFVEQWCSTRAHGAALAGVAASVGSLLLFGRERFLIPAMLVIALLLSLIPGEDKHA